MLSLLAVDLINVVLPLVVKVGVDAIPEKRVSLVVAAGIFYLVLMLLQAWGRYLWRIYLIGTSHAIARELRRDFYRHLQRLPLSYYQQVRTGDLMSRATNDIESIRMAIGPGILVTADAVLMFLLILPPMLWLSPKLTLLAFTFYPLVPWLTATLGDRIDTLYESMQRRMSGLGAFAQETFAGIRLIKSLVLEKTVQGRFDALSREYEKDGVELARYQSLFSPALGLLTNLGTLLILLLGGRDVIAGAITIGTFIAFQRFVVQLSWPMEAIGWTVTMHREGAAAHRRLQEVLAVTPAEAEPEQWVPKDPGAPLLELATVDFAYPVTASDAKPFRLRLAGLTVPAGKKIGIVGPVGSGKTTLFQLLLRLYEPERGSVRLEGRDLRDWPLGELRREVAAVEQQVFLFSESIGANVGLGRGAVVEPEELKRLAETAAIAEEIAEPDLGQDTTLRERGLNLSGGQKQRVALMRALARGPQLVLLDDCFAAVDVAVEQRIIEAFFRDYPKLAVLFASHRLSAMPRLDEVWLVEQGELVGRGTHADLLRGHALYRSLWEKSERQIEAERFEGPAEPPAETLADVVAKAKEGARA